ncbi:hypothetical protein [Dactylosporangium darangshiense]|uniref:Uncharacterized protein n=1 Tax=Dactylosporangium darangshiense TaxID=579108 RepID=A0ABP8D476_9ACTN
MSDRDDDRLLGDLGAAVREAAAVPESFLAAGRAAFAWRTVDEELATFAAAETATVRAAGDEPGAARLRSFTFAARRLTIEVEVGEDALVGQVVPPGPGRIELRSRHGSRIEAEVDDLGWFALRPLPRGMFRLYLHPANGSPVVTEWVTL